METTSLVDLSEEHLAKARSASSGRSAHTVHGGREHALRQTLIALAEGFGLDEHESPGEATLQVLRGNVRLVAGDDEWQGSAGDFVLIPPQRHSLAADQASVVLLTVSLQGGGA